MELDFWSFIFKGIGEGHIQSLILAAVLLMLGWQTIVVGFWLISLQQIENYCRIFDHTVNPKIVLFTEKTVSSCGTARF